MTATVKPRRRARSLLLLLTTVLCFGFLFGPGASAAQAQASDSCAIENFVQGEEVDLTAYAACVAAQNQGLARTGSDVGQYVGIGSALIALGAAFIWTSRRTSQRTQV